LEDGGMIATADLDLCAGHMAAILRNHVYDPRAVPAVGRVVPRPVREVSQLVVPEDGTYMSKRWKRDSFCGPDRLQAGEKLDSYWDAIIRIDTDAPTTWIERSTTREPRAWEASDVPDGNVVLYRGGRPVKAMLFASEAETADEANTAQADALYVLPDTLAVG
jgi:hypothetical protein